MVSYDFKTSGRCLLKGGKYVTDVTCEVKVEYSVTLRETKEKLSTVLLKLKLWDFQPLAAKPMAKYHLV